MKIGAVLTYYKNGRGGICGQVIGADGGGYQAVIFEGDDEECAPKFIDFIDKLTRQERETVRLIQF